MVTCYQCWDGSDACQGEECWQGQHLHMVPVYECWWQQAYIGSHCVQFKQKLKDSTFMECLLKVLTDKLARHHFLNVLTELGLVLVPAASSAADWQRI